MTPFHVFVMIAFQANASDMKYASLLCTGREKQFKKTSLRKKLSAVTDEQLEAIFMFLLQNPVEHAI
jgi:hypothetical protein